MRAHSGIYARKNLLDDAHEAGETFSDQISLINNLLTEPVF
jgi:hypothetical protein